MWKLLRRIRHKEISAARPRCRRRSVELQSNLSDALRLVCTCTGRILKGESRPPCRRSENLKTPKALGLTLPIAILLNVDEEIE
jgi:hypothetical protein